MKSSSQEAAMETKLSKPAAAIKQRLYQYIFLRFEVDSQYDRLMRLKSAEEFPEKPDGNEGGGSSQPNPNRMANAIIRRMEFESQLTKRIQNAIAEIEELDKAINEVKSPLEREVLRLRYTDGKHNRHMEWSDIALRIYGDNDEKHLLATYRLHGRALVSISKNCQN